MAAVRSRDRDTASWGGAKSVAKKLEQVILKSARMPKLSEQEHQKMGTSHFKSARMLEQVVQW
jgi:hypothetical protein